MSKNSDRSKALALATAQAHLATQLEALQDESQAKSQAREGNGC